MERDKALTDKTGAAVTTAAAGAAKRRKLLGSLAATCRGIAAALILAALLANHVIGEVIRDGNTGTRNGSHVDRFVSTNRSDMNIFYNNTGSGGSSGDSVQTVRNDSRICPKEHRVKARDTSSDKRKRAARSGGTEPATGRRDETGKSNFGCNACMREEMRSISLEAIKGNILSKLGMSQPPNLKGRPKPKIGDHRLAALLGRRHPHHGSNGVFWVVQDEEEGEEDAGAENRRRQHDFDRMQGDGPYAGDYSDKVIMRNNEFSYKSNTVRSHGNASDNRHSDNQFQEGEVLMEEEDDYHVRTEKIVTFSQPHPRIRHSPHVQYFQFSDKIRNSKVKKAILWVYIRGRGSANVVGDKITITVYKILDAGKTGSGGSRESPVITSVLTDLTQNVPNGAGAWITLDYVQIKNLVAEWFRYPQHNLGIIITADDANRTNLAVTSHNGNGTAFVPFLEVSVADNKKHRTKRTIGLNCNDSSNETRCCRYPLTVNFEDFGWDWIIAPKTYEANYCSGECPFVFLTRHPHTHVMQLADVPGVGPCCAPRKLSAISMLYFDQNMNIILGTVPDMVVDRCGCA